MYLNKQNRMYEIQLIPAVITFLDLGSQTKTTLPVYYFSY